MKGVQQTTLQHVKGVVGTCVVGLFFYVNSDLHTRRLVDFHASSTRVVFEVQQRTVIV